MIIIIIMTMILTITIIIITSCAAGLRPWAQLEAGATLRFARVLRGGLSYPTRFARKGPILPTKCFTLTDTQTFALLLYRLLLLLAALRSTLPYSPRSEWPYPTYEMFHTQRHTDRHTHRLLHYYYIKLE